MVERHRPELRINGSDGLSVVPIEFGPPVTPDTTTVFLSDFRYWPVVIIELVPKVTTVDGCGVFTGSVLSPGVTPALVSAG